MGVGRGEEGDVVGPESEKTIGHACIAMNPNMVCTYNGLLKSRNETKRKA